MKKIIPFILLITISSCMIGAGKNSKIESAGNNYFPKLSGIDLIGKEQKFPAIFKNKLNLVIVAFKREQQAEVDTWIESAKPILKAKPNLSLYEIPLIYELPAPKRAWVNNGMRFGIPDENARKRTITIYTNREEFFKITKMQEDKIYALLIDGNGKILWKKEGIADKKKLLSLKKILN